MRVVAKIGTSSVTAAAGEINTLAIDKLCNEIVSARRAGNEVVLVSSGAVTAGLQVLGLQRPADVRTLQAVSAVGQIELMRVYREILGRHGLVAGQALLTPLDFMVRQQYIHARGTIERLLEMGVVPIINENDAIADDALRYGDNDRIAALVANLIDADLLVLLTDAPGLLTADPRVSTEASLIEEISEIDRELEALAGGAGDNGSGGMSSKLAAAKMASWSGVRSVIAAASRPGVVGDAIDARQGVGTTVVAHDRRLAARKLWIAFAVHPEGAIVVDTGARNALVSRQTSLLPAGVIEIRGDFGPDAAVEILGPDGAMFAKGLVRADAQLLRSVAGLHTGDLPVGLVHETVHRDDLVVLADR
ncbi:MAG: glutamate 5-kinase [Actinomycetia bacterium]|nr:glutamate 5-kinase [Actinomycetes bacterium]MCP4958482.1 glutamate 5-kinase [Actinomycetes bacterium]